MCKNMVRKKPRKTEILRGAICNKLYYVTQIDLGSKLPGRSHGKRDGTIFLSKCGEIEILNFCTIQ